MSVSFPKLNIPTVISKNLQLLSFLLPYFSNLFWGLMFLVHCADVSYVLIFGMVKVLAPSFSPAMFTRIFFLQNLPADALPDGPVREKMANFKRPKKFKTSEKIVYLISCALCANFILDSYFCFAKIF